MLAAVDELSRTNGCVRSPWVALGERHMSATRIQQGAVNLIPVGEITPPSREQVVNWILRAQVYLWRSNVFTAMKSCPIPEHVISDGLLPFPVSYHTFEIRYEYNPKQIELMRRACPMIPEDSAFEWWLMVDRGDHALIMIFVSSMTQPEFNALIFWQLKYRTVFPKDFNEREIKDVSLILSMMAFLKSPDKHIQLNSIPRGVRRRANIVAQPDLDSHVSVITLRRKIYDNQSDQDHCVIDWKHQWWVQAHYRAQWYPSRQTHELIFIDAHLKGPDDKPLLEKVYNAARL